MNHKNVAKELRDLTQEILSLSISNSMLYNDIIKNWEDRSIALAVVAQKLSNVVENMPDAVQKELDELSKNTKNLDLSETIRDILREKGGLDI